MQTPSLTSQQRQGLAERYQQLAQDIAVLETRYKVQILAVSKTFSPQHIEVLAELGHKDFAENYVQEVQEKQSELEAISAQFELNWHFIGHLQSNKARWVAEHMQWVESVDRYKIAQALSAARPASLPALNICFQVKLSDETTKSGVAIAAIKDLLERTLELPRLNVRGLMCIGKAYVDAEQTLAQFQQLAQLFRDYASSLPTTSQPAQIHWDTLSMGMSADYAMAIRAGATQVRIGSLLFGNRRYV